MKVRRSLLQQTVEVRTRTAGGSYGDELAVAVVVPCHIDETRRMVRDAGGQQAVSEATLTLHPRTRVPGQAAPVDPMDLFVTGSEVKIDDRDSEVLSAKRLRLRGSVVAVEVVCA